MAGRNLLADSEAKWQKHVVVALWVAIAFLALLIVALLYGNAHGLFQELTGGSDAPWPEFWP